MMITVKTQHRADPQYRALPLSNSRDTNDEQHHEKHISDELSPGSIAASNTQDEPACVTRGCIQATARMLDSLDESVDPCDNFYEFACGNFIKNTFIPDDKANVDTFSKVSDKVLDQLRQIINEESEPNELKTFTLLKNLNKACLNKTILEQRGNAPLIDMLNDYGGWPVLKGDEWIEAGWDWIDAIKRFRQDGLDPNIVFTVYASADLKNSTTRKIYVSL